MGTNSVFEEHVVIGVSQPFIEQKSKPASAGNTAERRIYIAELLGFLLERKRSEKVSMNP